MQDCILTSWGLVVVNDKRYLNFVNQNSRYYAIAHIIRTMEWLRLSVYVGITVAAVVFLVITLCFVLIGREIE